MIDTSFTIVRGGVPQFNIEFKAGGVLNIVGLAGGPPEVDRWTAWSWRPNTIQAGGLSRPTVLLQVNASCLQLTELDAVSGSEPATGLRLFSHPGTTCGMTNATPIVGTRFHLVGAQFDVCDAAFRALPKFEQDLFERIEKPSDSISSPKYGGFGEQPLHVGIFCDVTSECPIVGPRFHRWGSDYDLCQRAFDLLDPIEQARFIRIDFPKVSKSLVEPPSAVPPPAPGSPSAIELVVDRSGSMASLVAASVAGLNSFLLEQRQVPQARVATVSLTTFDDVVTRVWNDLPLSSSGDVTHDMIRPRGNTALLDAIGSVIFPATVPAFGAHPTKLVPKIVVIVTDGFENASHRFTRDQIHRGIEERKREGWIFVFLAANQDAIATGGALGVSTNMSCTVGASPAGFGFAFGAASAQVSQARQGQATGFTPAQRSSAFHGK